jgi:hypothetical protein
MESETSVAVGSNGFVAVAYIGIQASGGSTNGYRFSKDGGKTWGTVSTLDSPGGRVASDPVLAVDSKDNFYMTWVGYMAQGMNVTDMHVYIAVAPAGTTTFGAPIEVTDPTDNSNPSLDKPWVVITHKETVLVTWANLSDNSINAARSTDGAKTFTRGPIATGAFRNLVFPCIPATGDRIWATYVGNTHVGLRWSDDDGATWKTGMVDNVTMNGVDDGMEQFAFEDPTCVADGNDVWVSYGVTSQPAAGNDSTSFLDTIRIAHTGDGGKTIDVRYSVTDAQGGKYTLLPTLSREANGALDLVYYAGSSEMDPKGSYRHSRSTDGGKTWDASVALKSNLFFTGDRGSPKWLGDYTGVAMRNGYLYTSYAENTGAFSHIAFYALVLPN